MLLDERDGRAGRVDGDGARALRTLRRVRGAALGRHGGNAKKGGEHVELYGVVGDVAHGAYGEARTVRHELDAVAVKDAATGSRRRDGPRAV